MSGSGQMEHELFLRRDFPVQSRFSDQGTAGIEIQLCVETAGMGGTGSRDGVEAAFSAL